MSDEQKGIDFIPMEFRSGKETLKNIPNRLITLVWKVISFQGIVLSLGTWLVYQEKVESYAWLLVVVLILFGRSGLDFIKEIKK